MLVIISLSTIFENVSKKSKTLAPIETELLFVLGTPPQTPQGR